MSYRNLSLDQLEINRANDRHGELENETAAIAWLFNNFEVHMRNLAKDIVAEGEVFEPPLVFSENEKWPAPGSADTELGVLMEPEVCHGATEVYARVQA